MRCIRLEYNAYQTLVNVSEEIQESRGFRLYDRWWDGYVSCQRQREADVPSEV